MKKINTVLLFFIILIITITTCKDSFLDVAPTTSLTSVELASRPGLDGALIGAYSILLGRVGFYSDATNWFWGSVLGGDANKGSDLGDQAIANAIQAYGVQSNNPAVLQSYSVLYEGVARANATLKLLQVANEAVSEGDLTRIEGEARFLRGHYYFELKKKFNNTPYVDENWDEVSPVPNDQDLWPFIEADFKFAFENLQANQIAPGRANKWAAGAYLAKAYLFQNKYTEAKPLFDDLIANGITASGMAYDLVPYYANVFRSTFDNSEESIFAAQAAAGTGSVLNANPGQVLNFPFSGPEGPGGCCGFFQPSLELANSFRTNADGLPLLDNSYNDPSSALMTDLGIKSDEPFTLDAGNIDPRLDHSVGRRGIPYLDWGPHPGFNWIRDQAYGGPYSPKKISYYQQGSGIENDISSWTPGYTAVNYNIIRFGDLLLMAAETEIELDNLEKGMEYINRVRTRAKNSPVPDAEANYVINNYTNFSNQAEARLALRFERRLELAGEGHRFYDLVRWGIAEEVINAYLEYEDQFLISPFAGARFTSGKNEYLPIPQNEIDLQGPGVLKQNPGY